MFYHVEQRKSYLPDKWTEYRPHKRNSKDCLLIFDILGISAKKPVNWNIFIYQGNKMRLLQDLISWEQLDYEAQCKFP